MTDADISAARAVHGWARTAGTATAIVDEDAAVSYARLAGGVRSLAGTFAAGGVRSGDRVAYLGRNSATLLTAALAAVHLGAVFVPLSFRLTGPEVARLLDDCGAHTLVADDEFRPVVDGIAGAAPARRFLLSGVGPAPDGPAAGPRWDRLDETATGDGHLRDAVPARPGDAALIMYTSGTTGRPKGAVLTHGNLWWNEVNTAAVIETRLRDTALVAAPMFHIAGLSGYTLGTLTHGGTLVVRRAFDPDRCLADLVAHRVANLIAVPTMFAGIARSTGFAGADLSALRGAIIGGAPVPVRLVREYAARGVTLQPAWGLTETAPLASYLPARLADRHPDAAGHPLPYTELRLVEPEQGTVLTRPGERGEIQVRGPNVIPRYWNDPAGGRGAVDDAGWFRSGDIGYLDGDGLLHVVDRLKDVIISGGENVYPAEIEQLLADLPGVREVAVVGLPHPRWDESPVAVLCQPGEPKATLEDVRRFVGDRLARFKLPTAVRHVDALPRNGSGKIDKAAVRASLLAAAAPAAGRAGAGDRPSGGGVCMSTDLTDVLVVGAGPAGLTLATCLRAQGVSVRVVDRTAGPPYRESAFLHGKGSEVLQRMGALGDLADDAPTVNKITAYLGRQRLSLRYTEPGMPNPARPMIISQTRIEQAMRDRLAEQDVTVEWDSGLVDLDQDATGVTAVLGNGGRIRAGWVVGCDGPDSMTRKAARIGFPGTTERYLMIDAHVDWPLDRDGLTGWLSPDGRRVGTMPMVDKEGGRDDLWRILARDPQEDSDKPSEEEIVSRVKFMLAQRTPYGDTPLRDITTKMVFPAHVRVADSFRKGRVLLVGDAAHAYVPFGGPAIHTGMGDGENLAWKLALVIQGRAGDELLGTYEAERRRSRRRRTSAPVRPKGPTSSATRSSTSSRTGWWRRC